MHFATESNPMEAANRSPSALAHPAPFRQTLVAKLNEYKAGLLEEFSDESEAFLHFVKLAVNEAEGLAWSTPYAHLFLPALAEEKIQYVRQWASRQCQVGISTTHINTRAS